MVILCLLLLAAVPLLGQAGNDYSLLWTSIDSGASTVQGGDYAMGATIGQMEAGEAAGGGYTMTGGFMSGIDVIAALLEKLHLPFVTSP